ncbi:hypothetical protein ACQI4E_22390 [Streptomyces sp. CA-252508]
MHDDQVDVTAAARQLVPDGFDGIVDSVASTARTWSGRPGWPSTDSSHP